MSEEKNEASVGNWDDFSNAEENGNGGAKATDKPKTLYMDTSKAGKYTVRPVGAHIKCRKSFKPYRATLSDEDIKTDPACKAGFYAGKRYAINVIDRADGKLKILEKGASVFKHFANYKATFGKDPADKTVGVDFQITVTIPKLPNGQLNKLKTEYAVMHIKETPLTKEEMDMIRAQKLWPLREIYKTTSLEKRIEMWNALPEAAKIAPKRIEGKDEDSDSSSGASAPSVSKVEDKPSIPVEDNMPGSPSDTEDLFEEKGVSADAGSNPDSAELF